MTDTHTLPDALADEIQRCRKLLDTYRNLPRGVGIFGAKRIENSLRTAIRAQASGDPIAMMEAYERLKAHE